MVDKQRSDPNREVGRLYEEAESRVAKAFEHAVSRGSFGELLARMTENVVALTKIGTDVFDLALRNMRVAGRQDVTRLARQLNRTEDKLELVLQQVELLEDQLTRRGQESGTSGVSARNNNTNGGGDELFVVEREAAGEAK